MTKSEPLTDEQIEALLADWVTRGESPFDRLQRELAVPLVRAALRASPLERVVSLPQSVAQAEAGTVTIEVYREEGE